MPRIYARPFSTLGRSVAIAVCALALACTSDGTTADAPDSPSIALEVTPQQLNVVYGQGSSTSAAITVTWHGSAAGDVAIEVQPVGFMPNDYATGVTHHVSDSVLTPSEPATTIHIGVRSSTLVRSYPFLIIATGTGAEPDTSQLVLNVVAPGPPAQFRMDPVDNSPVLTNSALSVYAFVLDSEGNILLNVPVEWAVESGGGSLDRTLSYTNQAESGDPRRAQNIWHLGAGEGEQALLLRVQGTSVTHRYAVMASNGSS